MTRDGRGQGPIELDAREREILRTVVQSHILSGEPVGSKTVSRGRGLDLSPATIRNVMADLEEMGLLAQPHPSAGRVPTDRAYRLYVDRLMGPARMEPAQLHAIDEALLRSRGEIPELLGEASRQLSRFSNHVGVVLAPENGGAALSVGSLLREKLAGEGCSAASPASRMRAVAGLVAHATS